SAAIQQPKIHRHGSSRGEPAHGPLRIQRDAQRARHEITGTARNDPDRRTGMRERAHDLHHRPVAAKGVDGAALRSARSRQLACMPWTLRQHELERNVHLAEGAAHPIEHPRGTARRRIGNDENGWAQKLNSRNRSKPYCGGRLPMFVRPGRHCRATDDGSTLASTEKPCASCCSIVTPSDEANDVPACAPVSWHSPAFAVMNVFSPICLPSPMRVPASTLDAPVFENSACVPVPPACTCT